MHIHLYVHDALVVCCFQRSNVDDEKNVSEDARGRGAEVFPAAIFHAGAGDEEARAQTPRRGRRRTTAADIEQIVSDRHFGTGQILGKVAASTAGRGGRPRGLGRGVENVQETGEKNQSPIGGGALRTAAAHVRRVQRLPEVQARVQAQSVVAAATTLVAVHGAFAVVVFRQHFGGRLSTGQRRRRRRRAAETASGPPDNGDGETGRRQGQSGC